MDGIANISKMLPKIMTWLHKVRTVHGRNTASLLPMALCAELDLVLCKCVFIPCWVKIDPVSLLFGTYENFGRIMYDKDW